MKLIIINPATDSAINFRIPLIREFIGNGWEVVLISGNEERKEVLERENVKFYCVEQKNRGLNPFSMLRYKRKLTEIIRAEKPDAVFTFQVKPNVFGVPAAKKAGVKNICAMVEGLGDVFINDSFKWKMIRRFVCVLYKRAFRWARKVFFLNSDDKAEFLKRKLVKEEQCEIIPGVGVDLEKFTYKPIRNRNTFLMVARMLKTKGVLEYCRAARIVKKTHPEAVFNYLGAEGTLKVADIQEYIDDGSINYLGVTEDVRPYLENSLLLLLLSSYREGLPMSIMEAEATGRAVITSNNVGCKDTVIDGYNGFLCEKGDVQKMAEKAIWCLEHPEEAEQMGKNARTFAEEHFNAKKINEKIFHLVNKI